MDIRDFNGSWKQQLGHTHKVMYWHVPGGWDYANVRVVEVFFPSETDAQSFHDSINFPPECPNMVALDKETLQ